MSESNQNVAKQMAGFFQCLQDSVPLENVYANEQSLEQLCGFLAGAAKQLGVDDSALLVASFAPIASALQIKPRSASLERLIMAATFGQRETRTMDTGGVAMRRWLEGDRAAVGQLFRNLRIRPWFLRFLDRLRNR
jgi:hypothetical protein